MSEKQVLKGLVLMGNIVSEAVFFFKDGKSELIMAKVKEERIKSVSE